MAAPVALSQRRKVLSPLADTARDDRLRGDSMTAEAIDATVTTEEAGHEA